MEKPIALSAAPKLSEWPAEIECTPAEYLAHYAAEFYEYVSGKAIKMSPIHIRHNQVRRFMMHLFEHYLRLQAIGTVEDAPFLMELPEIGHFREPDLQIILHPNPGQLTPTRMIGPADICIEIVSPESVQRDYGEKLAEYEQGGVGEYWIIDPMRRDARFYRQAERADPAEPRLFLPVPLDADSHYHTPLLPGLMLHVPLLWHDPLPDIVETGEIIQAMFKDQ